MAPKRSWPAMSQSCSRTVVSLRSRAVAARRTNPRGAGAAPDGELLEGEVDAHGRPVVVAEEVVHVALDDGRLARRRVAEHEHLEDLRFRGSRLGQPPARSSAATQPRASWFDVMAAPLASSRRAGGSQPLKMTEVEDGGEGLGQRCRRIASTSTTRQKARATRCAGSQASQPQSRTSRTQSSARRPRRLLERP